MRPRCAAMANLGCLRHPAAASCPARLSQLCRAAASASERTALGGHQKRWCSCCDTQQATDHPKPHGMRPMHRWRRRACRRSPPRPLARLASPTSRASRMPPPRPSRPRPRTRPRRRPTTWRAPQTGPLRPTAVCPRPLCARPALRAGASLLPRLVWSRARSVPSAPACDNARARTSRMSALLRLHRSAARSDRPRSQVSAGRPTPYPRRAAVVRRRRRGRGRGRGLRPGAAAGRVHRPPRRGALPARKTLPYPILCS